ncbi:MAG: beta-glucuronidase, partial [Lentisphaeria bacterium]|nr:beta-glucuronidase [Lentisphaeria bacterium]
INDEFGGFMYLPPDKTGRFAENTWGYYGMEIKNDDEFLAKIKEQTIVMAELPDFSGYCYTQLTDVEQEQNGVLTYDRVPKAPLQKLRDAFCVNPEWFE